MNDLLDTWFDVIERASMTKALEKGDERLAGEAAEAREKLREEFDKMERDKPLVMRILRGLAGQTDFNLDECLDVIERAAKLYVSDEQLREQVQNEVREVRERIREEFTRLQAELHEMSQRWEAERGTAMRCQARIAELESQLLTSRKLEQHHFDCRAEAEAALKIEREREHYTIERLEKEKRELEAQLKSKHPCDETCPACWGLAKELTEAQERIKELQAAFEQRRERIQGEIDRGGRKT